MVVLKVLYQIIWSPVLLAAIVGVGLFFTIALKGIQFRRLWYGLQLAFSGRHHGVEKGDISHFQSLMTSLAATLGIGNIAGVATAMSVGGLGALFWMWIIGWLGMATKYAESLLAVKYRIVDERGQYCGGPNVFIEKGLGYRKLALLFSFCGALAALGGGNMLQANTVVHILSSQYQFDPVWVVIALTTLSALVLLGGIHSVGRVASIIVPVMALLYIGGGIYIIALHWQKVPMAIYQILSAALGGQAMAGGVAGVSVLTAIQTGISRGLMTSEAGLGTGSIAAASAKTDCAVRQALVSMTGGFLSTVLMCTVTALVLSVTDVITDTSAEGAFLTCLAFTRSFSLGAVVVTVATVLFGFTTLLGWAFYGERCVEHFLGEKAIWPYRALFVFMIIPGGLLQLGVVWAFSDIANAMMAIPTLIGISFLSRVVIEETELFFQQEAEERESVFATIPN